MEANYLVALADYLLKQGYYPEDITIMAMYNAQVVYISNVKLSIHIVHYYPFLTIPFCFSWLIHYLLNIWQTLKFLQWTPIKVKKMKLFYCHWCVVIITIVLDFWRPTIEFVLRYQELDWDFIWLGIWNYLLEPANCGIVLKHTYVSWMQ